MHEKEIAVSPAAETRHLLISPLAVPALGGLLLVVVLAAVDCPGGPVQTVIDRILSAGMTKYLHLDTGAMAAAPPASWAAVPQILAAAIWLTLAMVQMLRPAMMLAVTLLWAGGTLSAVIAIAATRGWYLSPALPLVATFVCALLLNALGGLARRLSDARRFQRLAGFQQRMLEALATLAETRDAECVGHIARMRNYVRILAERLAVQGRHADLLTPEYRERLVLLSPLHDIGKSGVRDAVLLKPGRLTEEEVIEMQRHVDCGELLLNGLEQRPGEEDLFGLARAIIASHHERWDGGGYPRGLKGNEIPLAGRIVAVADVYDALISKRCYKAAYTREQSRAIIMKGRGTAFDPDLADAFLAVEEELWKVSLAHSDTVDSLEGARP
jgi:adenylate cyclase